MLILERVESSLDNMCPIKTFSVEEKQPDWLTKEVKTHIKEKRKLLQLARNTKSEEDWNKFRERRLTSPCIRQSKAHIVKEKLAQNNKNPKKFWEIINNSFGNLKARDNINSFLYDSHGGKIEFADCSNYLNNYLATVGAPDVTISTHYSTTYTSPNVTEFEFEEVSVQEVNGLIRDIDITKSSSIKHLNSRVLNCEFSILVTQLVHLFNCSLGGNIFPESWKTGKIIPIPNNKDTKHVANWRPISLLSLPGKLLENLAHKQLFRYLSDNKFMSELQHGFTNGKSTFTALQDYLLYTSDCINRRQICGCLFIDLSKAFDSLDRVRLLYKLKTFGICNNSGLWFESYLKNQNQVTLFNSITSTNAIIEYGVPQGSTLGPLLYILYVNDCFKEMRTETSKFIMYADNTALISTALTYDDLVGNVQQQMDTYYSWCLNNGLRINVNETKIMILCSKYNVEFKSYRSIGDSIVCDGKTVKSVDKYVYLGVDVDSNLTFEPFIKSTIQKVNYKLYLFGKIRYLLTFAAAVLVYKQMILPFFDYLDIILDSCPKFYVEKLQQLQFRGIKIIFQYKWKGKQITYSDEGELHNELELHTLKHRRIRHILITMFDLKSRRVDLLDSYDCGIGLRSSTKIKFNVNISNSEIYGKSFYIRGVKYWNQLPSELQTTLTKLEFNCQMCITYREVNKQGVFDNCQV